MELSNHIIFIYSNYALSQMKIQRKIESGIIYSIEKGPRVLSCHNIKLTACSGLTKN